MNTLHDRLDFDCLKLDDAVEDIPGLLNAIRSNQKTVKSVIIQLPFPLDLTEEQRRWLLEEIGDLPELEKLNIECYDLSKRALDDFVASLQRNLRPPLEEFCVWDLHLEDDVTNLDPLVMALSSLPTLTTVALGVEHNNSNSNNDNDDAEEARASILCESSLVVLCHNPRLTSLRLANLGLDQKRIQLLTEALEMNTGALKSLELHGEKLETESWIAMANGLERNTSLERFSLFDFKGMDDTGAIALAQALRMNESLRSLSLENDDDSVSEIGNIAMARMLESNSALVSLCFSSRGLNDDACIAFAEALGTNQTLRELELGTYQGGRVGSRGVSAIANMLPRNSSLQKLCMCCQQGLDDNGAIAIANGLTRNTTLRHLLLEDDDDAVTSKGYEALVTMMQSNTVLNTLYHENAGHLKVKMDYFLKLNQTGIRTILLNVNATRSEFLDTLVSHQEDLDCVHYMISMNPSFVSHDFLSSS